MAVKRINKPMYFTGLSSDTKPSDSVSLLSEFNCTDNGDVYIYRYTSAGDGTKAWELLLT